MNEKTENNPEKSHSLVGRVERFVSWFCSTFLTSNYRITMDGYLGYEVQKRRWWFPVWIQVGDCGRCTNTSRTIDEAKNVIERHRNQIIFTTAS